VYFKYIYIVGDGAFELCFLVRNGLFGIIFSLQELTYIQVYFTVRDGALELYFIVKNEYLE
jgi:hypothetical protein